MLAFSNQRRKLWNLMVAACVGAFLTLAPFPVSAQTPLDQAWNILQAGPLLSTSVSCTESSLLDIGKTYNRWRLAWVQCPQGRVLPLNGVRELFYSLSQYR